MAKKWQKGDMKMKGGGSWGGAYFLAMIGAAVYYLHTSVCFWGSVAALAKAVVWPAFLIYHLLGL